MPTEDFTQKLTNDITTKQTDKLTSDIYSQLANEITDKGVKGPNYDKDFAIAQEKLKGILPGITLIDIDNNGGDANKTGLRVDDEGIIGKPKETYTIDPKTGIGRSDDGTIQAIVTADGKIQRFDYDGKNADGSPKLVAVTDANGTTYKIDPVTGKATYTELVNGVEQTMQTKGTLSIDQGSGKLTIENDDGTTEVHNVDGSMVKYDAHKDASGNPDRVMEVRFGYDPKLGNQRESMKFTYDDKGNLSSVENQKHEVWTKKDGKWVSSALGPDGKPYTSDADFSVDSSGNVTIRHANDRETYHPDGKVDKVYIDKSIGATTTVVSDRYGNIREINASNGRNIGVKWDGNRESAVTMPDGTTYQRTGDKWALTDGNGEVIPTGVEIKDVKVFSDGTLIVFTADGFSTTYKNGNPVQPPTLAPPKDPTQKDPRYTQPSYVDK